MSDLMKISELSSRYDVSTRTLRYYEEMGLIRSQRLEGYAYRMYDEQARIRLKQILVLRKLNISIRDIARIFAAEGSDAVLDVLTKKTEDIDDEISLLFELKKVVLSFIRQIEKSDFTRQEDIDRLFQMAGEIERAVTGSDYEGASAQGTRLNDIAARTRRLLGVRVVELPKAKIGIFSDYDQLPEALKRANESFYPARFSRFHGRRFIVEEFMLWPEGQPAEPSVQIEDFPDGLYAVAVLQGDAKWGIETDAGLMYKWVGENDFVIRGDAHLMWNSLPSKGGQPPLIEMYVPIARAEPRALAAQPDEKLKALLDATRIRRTTEVDLRSLIVRQPASSTTGEGEIKVFNDDNDLGGLFTEEKFALPLMVVLRAKTDSTNIRLSYGKGGIVFNWAIAIDCLIGRDISDGSFFHHEPGGYIPIDEFAEIVWVLEREYMAVAVDGELRYFQRDMPYIRNWPDGYTDHISINASFQSTVTVAALTVYEIEACAAGDLLI